MHTRRPFAHRICKHDGGFIQKLPYSGNFVFALERPGVNCAGQDFAESESEGLWVGDEEAAGAVWALRRQGDMLYMVNTCLWCFVFPLYY